MIIDWDIHLKIKDIPSTSCARDTFPRIPMILVWFPRGCILRLSRLARLGKRTKMNNLEKKSIPLFLSEKDQFMTCHCTYVCTYVMDNTVAFLCRRMVNVPHGTVTMTPIGTFAPYGEILSIHTFHRTAKFNIPVHLVSCLSTSSPYGERRICP